MIQISTPDINPDIYYLDPDEPSYGNSHVSCSLKSWFGPTWLTLVIRVQRPLTLNISEHQYP